MSAYILILVIWSTPAAISQQRYVTKAACENAKLEVWKMDHQIKTVCVPEDK